MNAELCRFEGCGFKDLFPFLPFCGVDAHPAVPHAELRVRASERDARLDGKNWTAKKKETVQNKKKE